MEKAVLVNLATNQDEKSEAEESMDELAGLARAAGAQVVHKVFQFRPRISPRYFIGEGKVEEISRLKKEHEVDLIILDHNLSAVQQRSLEDAIQAKVLDRTQLILDIFAQRARSNEGKLQVELAQLSYYLPRLVGKGRALSRLGGGIGTRGPGEKKLEEDRRRILERITKIKKDIQDIQKRRANQRLFRKESPVPVVSLVGYTSAGKTTLFNQLSREKMFTSPELFATLDPVLRRVTFSDGTYFFLSDTVGFIKKLPLELITSFKATLDEVKEADCICHLIDINNAGRDSQVQAVEKILSEMGVGDVPIVKIYNKIDTMPNTEELLEQNKNSNSANLTVYISAKSGAGIDSLKAKLRALLFREMKLFFLSIPRDKTDMISSFPKWSQVLEKREDGDFVELKIMAKPDLMLNYLPYLKRGEENC